MSIEAGCNGVEAAIVLIAGIVAFPASLQHKVIAILAGFVFVQALNIVRIISLFIWASGITPCLSGFTSTFGPC